MDWYSSFHALLCGCIRGRDHSRWRTRVVHRQEHARCCDPWLPLLLRASAEVVQEGEGHRFDDRHRRAIFQLLHGSARHPVGVGPEALQRQVLLGSFRRGLPRSVGVDRVHRCVQLVVVEYQWQRCFGPALHLPRQLGRSRRHDPLLLSLDEENGSGLRLSGRCSHLGRRFEGFSGLGHGHDRALVSQRRPSASEDRAKVHASHARRIFLDGRHRYHGVSTPLTMVSVADACCQHVIAQRHKDQTVNGHQIRVRSFLRPSMFKVRNKMLRGQVEAQVSLLVRHASFLACCVSGGLA